ncbi:Cullin-domain-containing protein [Violaceomyces palustris]|uniref:Cullin-domain-containing protein n=1 Tax=Violaceomyces palustris TaxID=1673888 RepID=A0ACD0NZE9_9BASI|nr:Cullin-domain-containing protein [Violaceomyces palustris]
MSLLSNLSHLLVLTPCLNMFKSPTQAHNSNSLSAALGARSSPSSTSASPFSSHSRPSHAPVPKGFASLLARASSSQQSQTSTPISIKPARPSQYKTTSQPPTPLKNQRHNHQQQQQQQLLIRSIRSILSSQSASPPSSSTPTTSYETLYSITEEQVSLPEQCSDLYQRVKLEMERAVGQIAASLRSNGSSHLTNPENSDLTWLNQLERSWSDWCDRVSLVRNILLPLDRSYLLSNPQLLSIWDLAMDIFGYKILQDSELSLQAVRRVTSSLNLIRSNPEGSDSNYQKLHSSIASMFLRLDSYRTLEESILQASSQFYRIESEAKLKAIKTADYLLYADRRLTEEAERSSWIYSDKRGRDSNLEIVRTELVGNHSDVILQGLPEMIEQNQLEILKIAYDLLKGVEQLPKLRVAFGNYIKSKGESIVQDREKDDEMIDRLLAYKERIDRIVSKSFGSDSELSNVQKDSFEVFINKRENKPAELIAKFLDQKLKSGNKTMSDQELEHYLDEALILFRYTRDKDMFEEFYKRHFAKRLLLNKSASSDAERSMLLKLKEECGPGFTAKLETMLKDVELSEDVMKSYQAHLSKASKGKESSSSSSFLAPDFELSVNVLTQAHWPTYPKVEIMIPEELNSAAQTFSDFYQGRNSGRRLHWQHSLGTLSILANFAKSGGGVKELQVSTFQAVVLLLFNRLEPGAKLSYSDIKAQTGLEEKELKRTLQSLACGQIPTRVLRKSPQGREVEEEDEFYFNENFKNERRRIRINQIQMKETAEEQKSTEQRVFLDRELVLQAAAVRVLKARKTIKHNELINEVLEQIKSRFTVEVSEIKKTFEILIDKEYMERVEGERGVYKYLA